MLHQDNHFSSVFSNSIHDKNNISTWEQVYDKYAPMMYGTIINMTHDEKMAGDILQEVFLDLKKKDIIPVFSTTLFLTLLRFTYKMTIKHLQARGLTPKNLQPANSNYPNINLFFFEEINLKEASIKSDLAENDIQKNLRAEFNKLRTHSH